MKTKRIKTLLSVMAMFVCSATSISAKQTFTPFWQTAAVSASKTLKATKGDYHIDFSLAWAITSRHENYVNKTSNVQKLVHIYFLGPVYSKFDGNDYSWFTNPQNFDWTEANWPWVNLWPYEETEIGSGFHIFTPESYWDADGTSMYCSAFVSGDLPYEIPTNKTVQMNSYDELYAMGYWVKSVYETNENDVYQLTNREYTFVCKRIMNAGLPNENVIVSFYSPYDNAKEYFNQ